MTCDRCFQPLADGDHGEGVCPYEPRKRSATVVPDEIPGGQWFENGFDTPQKFYSHSEHRAALAARGMELRPKYAGEHDKHLKRWDTVDLDGARQLLERGAQARKAKADEIKRAQEEFPITVTTLDETFRYEAER